MCILCEYRLSAKCVFAQAEAGGMSYSSSFSDAGQHPTTEKVLKYMQTRAWYINPRSAAFAVWVVGTGACTESMTADRIVTFEGAHFIHPEKCTCTDSSTDSSRAPYFVPVA